MRTPSGNDLLLGKRADGSEVRLSADQRSRHLYLVGASRSGKTKFLAWLIRQDIKAWRKSRCGLLCIDPHGELYHKLVAWLAWNKEYLQDRPIILIDPTS